MTFKSWFTPLSSRSFLSSSNRIRVSVAASIIVLHFALKQMRRRSGKAMSKVALI